MSYEMFEQGADVYVPAIILSLIVTLLAYGAFPLIFAGVRSEKITKRKYNVLCYVVNAVVMLLFLLANRDAFFSGGPYALWTFVFSLLGVKILQNRKMLEDSQSNTGEGKKNISADKQQNFVLPSSGEKKTNVSFCRKCGQRLIKGSAFCNKCGSRIDWK